MILNLALTGFERLLAASVALSTARCFPGASRLRRTRPENDTLFAPAVPARVSVPRATNLVHLLAPGRAADGLTQRLPLRLPGRARWKAIDTLASSLSR